MISIIVAVDGDGGFGKDGKIPWHFKCDFDHFKKVTDGKVCVMGKNTYQDMAKMMKARGKKIGKDILPNRTCYVVSKTLKKAKGATVVPELQAVLNQHDDVFVLGGEALFIQAIASAVDVHMTVIDGMYGCDRFFPIQALDNFNICEGNVEEENGTQLLFVKYRRKGL